MFEMYKLAHVVVDRVSIQLLVIKSRKSSWYFKFKVCLFKFSRENILLGTTHLLYTRVIYLYENTF